MKNADIAKLSETELQAKLAEFNSSYSELRRMHSMSPLDNPSEITKARKTIVRLKTALNSK